MKMREVKREKIQAIRRKCLPVFFKEMESNKHI